MFDAVCVGAVALVVAVGGGTIGVVLFEVLFPVRVKELLGVGGGILFTVDGGGVFGGKVIRLKLSDEDEVVLKFTLVNAPKPPITIIVLLSVVNLEKICVVVLLRMSVKSIFKRMSILIKILPCDFAVASS